jgi:hypothetical protein
VVAVFLGRPRRSFGISSGFDFVSGSATDSTFLGRPRGRFVTVEVISVSLFGDFDLGLDNRDCDAKLRAGVKR